MPKKVHTTRWECEGCGRLHNTEEEAADCEAEAKRDARQARWQKAFPSWHNNDSRFERYCVGCGTLVLAYTSKDFYGRNEPDREYFRLSGSVYFLDAHRCSECHVRLVDKLLDLIESSAEDE